MSYEPTYMDCWHFVSRLLPINSETARAIYCMVFHALKEADERQTAEKKKKKGEKKHEQSGAAQS